MATPERPSARFDSFGFTRARPSAGAASEPDASTPLIPPGERLAIAQGLRDLGYLPAQIELILNGPSATSVEAVTGRIIRARVMPIAASELQVQMAPSESTKDDQQATSDPAPGPAPPETPKEERRPTEPTEKKYPGRVAPEAYQLGIDQSDIIDAVWHNLHGDPQMLMRIADNFENLTGPLQAYVSAAVEQGKIYLVDLNQWIKDFDKAQAAKQSKRGEEDKQRKKTVGSIAGVAASAANLIPVVGQLLAVAIAAGVAISEAILEAFPLPLRAGADQVHDEIEGLDAFWGLTNYYPGDSPTDQLPSRDARFNAIKQAVLQDKVGYLLPIPRRGSMYKFTPHLDGFVRAAHELGLYEGEENTVVTATKDGP